MARSNEVLSWMTARLHHYGVLRVPVSRTEHFRVLGSWRNRVELLLLSEEPLSTLPHLVIGRSTSSNITCLARLTDKRASLVAGNPSLGFHFKRLTLAEAVGTLGLTLVVGLVVNPVGESAPSDAVVVVRRCWLHVSRCLGSSLGDSTRVGIHGLLQRPNCFYGDRHQLFYLNGLSYSLLPCILFLST